MILHTFLETRDHLSTDELHRLVQKKDARIGYTTVYRTLNSWRSADWPVKSLFTTASPATNINTTAAATTTWSAPVAAVQWNFFLRKSANSSRKSDANITTSPPGTPFRFTESAKTAARKTTLSPSEILTASRHGPSCYCGSLTSSSDNSVPARRHSRAEPLRARLITSDSFVQNAGVPDFFATSGYATN